MNAATAALAHSRAQDTHAAPVRWIGAKLAEPYQDRIATSIAAAIKDRRSGAVMAPTGSGKSLNVHTTVEDCLSLGYPIIVLHPSVDLLRQNLAQLLESPSIARQAISVFVAQNEPFPEVADLQRATFRAPIILATNASFVRRRANPEFQKQLATFARRKGVIVIDEGQTAGAPALSEVLSTAARAGAIGILLSATPFRADLFDPLTPFGASIDTDLIDIAEYDEVFATGRIVRTKFDLAYAEFEDHLSQGDLDLIESIFNSTLAQTGSVDAASSESFARLLRPDVLHAHPEVAEHVMDAIIAIWAKRSTTHRLALLHADSLAFAEALAYRISQTPFPSGHARASRKPSVGFVSGSEVTFWRRGILDDCDGDTRISPRRGRRQLLDLARAGDIDVLVNVATLGVGIDIPRADLSLICSLHRSPSPTKQISGRTERACPETGKTFHTLVDIGRSIPMLYSDVEAVFSGRAATGAHMRKLPRSIVRQFKQWFAKDPDVGVIAAPIAEAFASRKLDDFNPFAPPHEAAGRQRKLSAVCPGVYAIAHSNQKELVYDLAACGLLPPELTTLPAFARVQLERNASGATIHPSLESAATAPAPEMRPVIANQNCPASFTPWRPDGGPSTERGDAVAIANALAHAFGTAISRFGYEGPCDIALIDRPAAISLQRLAFLFAYANARKVFYPVKLRCTTPGVLDREIMDLFRPIAPIATKTLPDGATATAMFVSGRIPGETEIRLSRDDYAETDRRNTFMTALEILKKRGPANDRIQIGLNQEKAIEARNALFIPAATAKTPAAASVILLADAYRPRHGAPASLPDLFTAAMRHRTGLHIDFDVQAIHALYENGNAAKRTALANSLSAVANAPPDHVQR